jgi:hypothetical protein
VAELLCIRNMRRHHSVFPRIFIGVPPDIRMQLTNYEHFKGEGVSLHSMKAPEGRGGIAPTLS